MKTNICVIRHGETAWNIERRIQGHTDIELNAAGIKQARAAADWLQQHHTDIRHIYSSDLSRALRTASIVGEALGLSPTATQNLRERRYGRFEGLTYQQAEIDFPKEYALFESRDPDFAMPDDGESLKDIFNRITQTLETIAQAHVGETIAIVCHGGVLDIINRFVRQNPLHEKRDFDVPNAGLNWISYQPEGTPQWRVVEWGSTQHLNEQALDELPG